MHSAAPAPQAPSHEGRGSVGSGGAGATTSSRALASGKILAHSRLGAEHGVTAGPPVRREDIPRHIAGVLLTRGLAR